jgi:predicted RNase H-like HicB family nuclease
VYWQEGDAWLGHLEDFPAYWTQGQTLADLKEHLADLHGELTSGTIPGVRRIGELTIS